MSDYGETGPIPVEDAATADPPTEEEVRAAQEHEFPDQARTAMHNPPHPEGPEADD
jgi:hypothetical protein